MLDASCSAKLSAVLLRLADLGVINALALLRLLPMSDRDKNAEILACGARSWCSNGNSVTTESSSTRPTGPGWPLCYTR
jgi:hypothetical protein